MALLREIIDRKLCALLLDPRISPRKSENNVVERNASVQRELADQESPLIPQLAREFIKRRLTGIKISLVGSHLKCVLTSKLNRELEIRQLFLCPIYPERGLAKRAHA